jgi:hypothetical protein
VPVAKLVEVNGVVELSEGDVPVVIRRAYGLGEVVFVACALDEAPLRDWKGRNEFWRKVLRLDGDGGNEGLQQQYAPRGGMYYADLSGQLMTGLDQFRGVKFVSFGLVAGLIFLYILVIGPGDYVFLRFGLKKLEATWITFPLLVIGISAAAWGAASWLKGSKLHVNQVDVIDFDVENDRIRGVTWVNIFAPKTMRFDLELAANDFRGEALKPVTAWGFQGRTGLMETGNRLAAASGAYYYGDELGSVRGLPVQVWSSKAMVARYEASIAEDPVEFNFKLTPEGVIEGSVTNRTGRTLQSPWLIHDRWLFTLSDLAPGATVEFKAGDRRDLSTVLRGVTTTRVEKDQYQALTTSYQGYNSDPAYVLRYMGLYGAADGKSYTGATHAYQRFVDLSGQIGLGRPVLICQAVADRGGAAAEDEADVVTLLRAGEPLGGSPQDRRWTTFRFLGPAIVPPRASRAGEPAPAP